MMVRFYAVAFIVIIPAAVAAWLLFGAPSGAMPRIDADDPELVSLGERVYAAQCAACHGADLEGQPAWRVRRADGRLPAPPHDESGHTWHHSDQQLFALTKFGPAALAGGTYESDMPGFAEVLTDREIVAVLAYIKSRWPARARTRQAEIDARARSAGGS